MMRLVLAILWPSFLVAIAAEGFVFSWLDPQELFGVDSAMELSPMAVYSIGFFIIWTFCALSSMLTYYLINVPKDRPPRF